jgi:hypothetical protein
VHPGPEAERHGVGSGRIESVRVGESRRVPVGRAQQDEHPVSIQIGCVDAIVPTTASRLTFFKSSDGVDLLALNEDGCERRSG